MVKAFKYIDNFVEGSNSAKISIKRRIDQDRSKGINGADFSDEMDFLASKGVKEVTIEINSMGGNVKEGYSIFHAIYSAPFKTITKVVGIAASMAGMIAQAGDERVIMDYALYHTHGPHRTDGKEADTALMSLMTNSLKTILQSKSNVSEEEADKLLSSENMFSAIAAKNAGFFDRIEETRGVKLELNPSNSLEELFLISNSFINKQSKSMEKVTTFLSLANEASEDAILESVQAIQNKADKVEELENSLTEVNNELTESQARVLELENSLKDQKALRAEELVEKAISEGKVKEESKSGWIENARNDFDGCKNLLDSIVGTSNASNILDEVVNEVDAWDYEKWSKEDPKGLEKMQNDSPAKFKKLFDAYVG